MTADVADKEGLHKLNLSGTKFRKALRAGEDIPDWFAFKSVVQVILLLSPLPTSRTQIQLSYGRYDYAAAQRTARLGTAVIPSL